MHGFGDFIWTSGKSYSGFYNKDLKEGLGLFYWNNPIEIYFGYWMKGQRDGPAMQILNNTKTYSIWENGKLQKSFTSKSEALNYSFNSVNFSRKYKVFFNLDIDDLIRKFSKKTNE